MAPNADLLSRVRTALKRETEVVEKMMFGGITFMVRGKMCISVGRNRIMCRIDPKLHEDAVARQGCRAVMMKGRPYRGYLHVEAAAVKSPRELKYWISLALKHNRSL